MNSPENRVPLAKLRQHFGQPMSHDPAKPPASAKHRYVIRPTQFSLGSEARQLRDAKDIAGDEDSRNADELRGQIDDAVAQLVTRAATGDDVAISMLLNVARGVIDVLETLERAQPGKIQGQAAASQDWPVLMSQNPSHIRHAEELVRRLKVGEKAATPRLHGQKCDPHDFWTRLATKAFTECQENKIRLSFFQDHCAGISPERKSKKVWGIRMPLSEYPVSTADFIVIFDWEKECSSLALPVTRENLKKWQLVIRRYTFEYWDAYREEYAEAIRRIGQPLLEEWDKRRRAVNRVEQAFRDLHGLRKPQSQTFDLT